MSEGGSTLPEVLVGLLLLAMTLLAVVPMFSVAAHGVASARDRTAAVLLTRAKAEELRSAAFGDLAAGSQEETLILGPMAYQRSWTIVDDTPHPGLKEITVTVIPQRTVRLLAPRSDAQLVFHVAR